MSNNIETLKNNCNEINEIEKLNQNSNLNKKSLELFDEVLNTIIHSNESELDEIYKIFLGYKSKERYNYFNRLRTSIKKIQKLKKAEINIPGDIPLTSTGEFNKYINSFYNKQKENIIEVELDATSDIYTVDESNKENNLSTNNKNDNILPEELTVKETSKLIEGAKKSIVINAYERNPKARKECIQHYGAKCCICKFDFGEFYGKDGVGFIHVHHEKPLHEIDNEYEVDPIKDLKPVCPNCHAMIHKRKPAYSIDEIKGFINQQIFC